MEEGMEEGMTVGVVNDNNTKFIELDMPVLKDIKQAIKMRRGKT